MTNVAAFASITGRLTQDIYWFPPNADGSITGSMNLAVDNNYRSADGEVKTNMYPTKIYIPASRQGDKGSWDRVHKGDLIQAMFSLSADAYTDKQGQKVYPKAVTLTADGYPTFLEPLSVTSARLAKRQAEAQNAAPVAPVAQAAPVAQPVTQAPVAPAQMTQADLEARIAELEAQKLPF